MSSIELEQDIFTIEQYLLECQNLETSMGLYNLLIILRSWRKYVKA